MTDGQTREPNVNRIAQRFELLRARGESAFIPYITAGDPSLEQTVAIVHALEEAGADIVELGVPFSDPVGDGPVIQEAALRALQNQVNLPGIFDAIRAIRRDSQLPILLFSYYNPILVYGFERFARDLAEAGGDGVLCVDLPPEEAAPYKEALDAHGLATVFLIAPTTTEERLERVARHCTGFVYYVSRLGVTGERAALAEDLAEGVARIKRHVGKPVAVGFGISSPEHAREVAGLAEGVVVGSAIVRLIGECGDAPDTAAKVRDFARALAAAAKTKPAAAG